jgi:formate--tetrahydrofolate ligase
MSHFGPHDLEAVARRLDLPGELVLPYGRDKAKVALDLLDRPPSATGASRLVLVTGMTPTPAGEGKTTTTIGLVDGLVAAGKRACAALREPSLGPCFGLKGGGTGHGRARLVPDVDINLHFNGDLHAITAAHNLLAALVDNALHHRLLPQLDASGVLWKRVLDMNDRSLRYATIGLGGGAHGVARESGFDITAASEVMAVMALARDLDDLRARLGRIVVAIGRDRAPITADALGATGAMTALLKDALQPNLVRTAEGSPAFVHCGPFANIAHGCSSVLGTRMALHAADWVVTEAGFGFDLGGEKFFDIKCRAGGFDPAAVVIVATARALKLHGGHPLAELDRPSPEAVVRGTDNLARHLESVAAFGKPAIVAINRFPKDTADELAQIEVFCRAAGVPCAGATHAADGAAGARDLAEVVIGAASASTPRHRPLYDLSASFVDKATAIATKIYGARGVVLAPGAKRDLEKIPAGMWDGLAVCMAKTPNSLSDDPTRLGRPRDFDVTIRRVELAAGAGFAVALTGEVMRMPGLPRRPRAHEVDVKGGAIVGIE